MTFPEAFDKQQLVARKAANISFPATGGTIEDRGIILLRDPGQP